TNIDRSFNYYSYFLFHLAFHIYYADYLVKIVADQEPSIPRHHAFYQLAFSPFLPRHKFSNHKSSWPSLIQMPYARLLLSFHTYPSRDYSGNPGNTHQVQWTKRKSQ